MRQTVFNCILPVFFATHKQILLSTYYTVMQWFEADALALL
jgi:hypothetical protein